MIIMNKFNSFGKPKAKIASKLHKDNAFFSTLQSWPNYGIINDEEDTEDNTEEEVLDDNQSEVSEEEQSDLSNVEQGPQEEEQSSSESLASSVAKMAARKLKQKQNAKKALNAAMKIRRLKKYKRYIIIGSIVLAAAFLLIFIIVLLPNLGGTFDLTEGEDPSSGGYSNNSSNVSSGGSTINESDHILVQIAKKQMGQRGNAYRQWFYGYDDASIPWCSVFVAWASNEAGLLDVTYPREAHCNNGISFYQSRGKAEDRSYGSPKSGDIIFFDWKSNGLGGSCEHVGIVEWLDGSTVHYISGNDGNMVKEASIPLGDLSIMGYGIVD